MPDEPILRPWRPSDAPALLRHRRGAPDLENNMPEIADLAAARAAIEGWQQEWFFAIVHNGVAVGNVAVSAINRVHGLGWFHYWMAPATRGRHWTTRAACTLADWALFDSAEPLYRLELGHRVNNPASGHVARSAGFVQEGREREKLQYHGIRHDTLSYARLRTDPRPVYEPLEIQP